MSIEVRSNGDTWQSIKSTVTLDYYTNFWSKSKYSYTEVKKLAKYLGKTDGCTDCENCIDCQGCCCCTDCTKCKGCYNCVDCYKCFDCSNCINEKHSERVNNIEQSQFKKIEEPKTKELENTTSNLNDTVVTDYTRDLRNQVPKKKRKEITIIEESNFSKTEIVFWSVLLIAFAIAIIIAVGCGL